MIDLGHMNGDSGESGNSMLAHFVRQRLPENYMINEADLRWLDFCDDFLRSPPTNESVTKATREAFAANLRGHIDPFELLIDADICDTKCDPRM